MTSSTSAIGEVRGLGELWRTQMIEAFRETFLAEPGRNPATGTWDHPELRRKGLALVLSTLVDRSDADGVFAFARSTRFLQAQAEESARPGGDLSRVSPLQTLDIALAQAVRSDRIAEMAAFTLARPFWADRLADRTPLLAIRAGDRDGARALADACSAAETASWYLIMAWELHDAGAREAARDLLAELLRKDLPQLDSRVGRHTVVLLRYAAEIGEEAFCALQEQLLDDNDRVDLGRELIKAGRYDLVPAVAKSIRLFHESRISVLTEAAKAAASAGHDDIARQATAQATETLPLLETDEDKASRLPLVASAQAACGDDDQAGETFARAIAVSERLPDRESALRTIAVELATAGRLAEAEQVSRSLRSFYLGEALEALAVAQVKAGQTEAAWRTLEDLDLPSYPDRRRAVRDVGHALAATGHAPVAADLARMALSSAEEAGPLASIAQAAAKFDDLATAVRIARSITDPGWRAHTLTHLCATYSGGADLAAQAREAVNAVTEPDGLAELLAQVAAVQPAAEQGPMFDEALRLAGADGGERWRTLAEIGVAQVAARFPGAEDTFARARRAIRDAEDDPWFWTDDLWRLGMAQVGAGDTAGARNTFADLLRTPVPGPERGLRPTVLAGAATGQAQAGDLDGARQTLKLARRRAKNLHGEWVALFRRAATFAQVAIGDLDGAAKTVARSLASVAEWDDDEEADDVDEHALAAAAEQGVLAAVFVARQLVQAERPDQARKLLRKTAKVRGLLVSIETIAELASAHAALGQYGRAARAAGGDGFGFATDRMAVVMARHQADAGDIDFALMTAARIGQVTDRARAVCEVARSVADHGDQDRAETILADAASQFQADTGDDAVVLALIEIAAAAADTGAGQFFPVILAAARDFLDGLDPSDQRDFRLTEIARCWARHRDIDRALELANELTHNPYRAGQVKFEAVTAAVADKSGTWAGAEDAIKSIEHIWWRAAGLVLLAGVEAEQSATAEATYLTEALGLVSQVPQGHNRTRLQALIAEIMVENGSYIDAIQMARSVVVERPTLLAELARELASRGATSALKQLLPDCSRFADAAYQACLALATAVPAQAARIIAEIDAAGQLWSEDR